MQVCTSLQQITVPAPHHLVFLQAGCSSRHPANSIKALKALVIWEWSVSAIWHRHRPIIGRLFYLLLIIYLLLLSALTLLVGRQEGHPACKKTEWWGCWHGCQERCVDLHMAQLMPLPLTVSCFSKIQIRFTFMVPAHLGSPGQRAVKWVSVYFIYCWILFHCNYFFYIITNLWYTN